MKIAHILDTKLRKKHKKPKKNQFQIKILKKIIMQYDKSVLIIGK